ncbi:MAG TPA: outer membrane beta-barrel protein [Candidatus Acidoferrum sp.]|nr:outer membrane beta-barrel protein [Candidatus Acidoferrum sp.]
MRATLIFAALLFVGASTAMAQEGISGDAAVTYQWVHTNAGPGQCGCFGLNGGGISASWNVRGPWSVVADFSSQAATGAPTVGSSLTLTSGLAGARFELPRMRRTWIHGAHRVQPFAQILMGASHAGGGAAGLGDATVRFAAQAGGGIDVPVSRRFSVRGQVDYFATTFANATNDHQNNLLIGAGVVYHWSFAK